MSVGSISREDILRSTLFHIQLNRCQYIDNFPEQVTNVLQEYVLEKGVDDYAKIRRKLYSINTSFFRINKIKKRDFYEGLYRRIKNLTELRS
ncbi:MAG: hypothetical protein ACTSVD_10805 [Candidatus Thorarchaeota archaeon]